MVGAYLSFTTGGVAIKFADFGLLSSNALFAPMHTWQRTLILVSLPGLLLGLCS